MRKTGLLLAGALAVSSALADTANLSDLAECKLDWNKAKAALADLRVTNEEDLSGDDVGIWIETHYDVSALGPAGLTPTDFKHEVLGANHYLVATLSVSYAEVRAKILAAYGRTACSREFGSSGKHQCYVVERPKFGRLPGVLLDEKKASTEIQCSYSKVGKIG